MRCDLLVDVAVEGCWRLLKCVQNGLIGLGSLDRLWMSCFGSPRVEWLICYFPFVHSRSRTTTGREYKFNKQLTKTGKKQERVLRYRSLYKNFFFPVGCAISMD